MEGWTEIHLHHIPPERVEALSEALEGLGALSVTYQDDADQPLFEPAPGETRLWRDTRIIGLFPRETDPASLIEALERLTGLRFPWEARPLADQDWALAWAEHFRPMRFGDELWVVPHGQQPPAVGTVLHLSPGLAFGTGTHPTTALCLEWLAEHRTRLQGTQVVDYGCGSGILAIAAALLGAERVDAVDIDPQALTATADNAAANQVAERIHPHPPDTLKETTADVLLANILANPLKELAPHFARLLKPGGTAVLSGILEAQAEAVIHTYQGAGFAIVRREHREGWIRLDFRRD